MQKVEEHLRVLLGHNFRVILALAAINNFSLFRYVFYAFYLIFPVFNFPFEPHHVGSLIAPLYLAVILSFIKETSMVLRVARSRRLPLTIEQGVWVSLRVACGPDGGYIGEVGDEWPPCSKQAVRCTL